MQARWTLSILSSLALFLAACGGTQETVESPESSSSAAAVSDDVAEAEGSEEESTEDEGTESKGTESKGTESDADEEEETAGATGSSLERPPSEILTTQDVAFTFDYNASAMKEKHREKCAPAAKDDPAVLARCAEQERKKFHADVLWFRKDPNTGELVWIVYKRQGNRLIEVFRNSFVFEDEAGTSVTMRLVGKGKGGQQIYAARRRIPIQVPTKYGLIIDDPTYGELKYNSKVGLVAAQNQ